MKRAFAFPLLLFYFIFLNQPQSCEILYNFAWQYQSRQSHFQLLNSTMATTNLSGLRRLHPPRLDARKPVGERTSGEQPEPPRLRSHRQGQVGDRVFLPGNRIMRRHPRLRRPRQRLQARRNRLLRPFRSPRRPSLPQRRPHTKPPSTFLHRQATGAEFRAQRPNPSRNGDALRSTFDRGFSLFGFRKSALFLQLHSPPRPFHESVVC